MSQYIFLSYSPRDAKFVKKLRDHLLRMGLTPWIDPNPRPGEDWRFAIDDAIRFADAMLLIITPDSMKSHYVTYEWAFALGVPVPVIPIIVANPGFLHPRLASLRSFDINAWRDEMHFWDYFVRELPTMLRNPQPPAHQPAPPVIQQQMASPPPQSAPPAAQPGPPQQAHIPDFSRSVMPHTPGHWLVVRRGPNLNQMYRLDQKPLWVIGRDESNDIAIVDPEVSRQHAKIQSEGAHYVIEDLGSTNDTFINGQQITEPQSIHHGDVIGLGDTILLSFEVIG